MILKNIFITALIFILAGCEYETSLTDDHKIPVSKTVLGLWEAIPEKNGDSDSKENLMVLKYTDTEYLIHYPTGDEGFYFRGYPIRIGGISCVQVRLIGDSNGDIKTGDRKFHVVSYKFINGELEVKTLNTDMVNKNLKDRNKLKTLFLMNKNKEELFINPVRFRKAVKKG